MKLRTLNKSKANLLKLKLLNTKIHKNQKNFDYLLLKEMKTRLKKILQLIYAFHAANKKILFIGTPLKLNNKVKQLLKNKKHSFIPESIWMGGVITNANSSFKYLIKRHAINNDKMSKFLFTLKNQADLIVVLNEKLNITALTESSLKRIPIISLNATYNLTNFNLSTYKVSGDYIFTKKTARDSLFFLLLGSLLKKAETLKKKQIRINMKKKRVKHVKKTWNHRNYKKKKKNEFLQPK